LSAKIYQYNLPLPPSVNSLWRAGRARMYRSKKYLEWISKCEEYFANRVPPFINYPFAIEIAMGRPSKRKMDIDNRIKAVLDVLERVRVIEDDSLAWHLTVYWEENLDGCRVTINKAGI